MGANFGAGGGFALIVVLFILLIILGAAWCYDKTLSLKILYKILTFSLIKIQPHCSGLDFFIILHHIYYRTLMFVHRDTLHTYLYTYFLPHSPSFYQSPYYDVMVSH